MSQTTEQVHVLSTGSGAATAAFHQADPGAAGQDIRAQRGVTIDVGETVLVSTGIRTAFRPGVVALIFARSGLATKKGIVLANQVGVIDSSYRGEWLVALKNTGAAPVTVAAGERIAQTVFVPYVHPEFVQVTALPDSARGEGGFGSSGK